MYKIKTMLKKNSIVYSCYTYFFSAFFKFVGMFVRVNRKQILFLSFGGRSANDSPRVIYNEIIKDKRFDNYKLIWALDNVNKYEDIKCEKINVNSLRYFIIALQSGYWVTNSSIERGLVFKKKLNVYVNTWHGTPLKKMGKDYTNDSVKLRTNLKSANLFTSQGKYDEEIFVRAMGVNPENIRRIGLPRNDMLFHTDAVSRKKLRSKFGLSENDRVILYAPTQRDDTEQNRIKVKYMIELLENLPKNYKILFRDHYSVNDEMNEHLSLKRMIDVSQYENGNNLMIMSDMLLTDYSSILFDYSILEKPIFLFCFDYDEYVQHRGMYFDIEDKLVSARTITALTTNIETKVGLSENKVKSLKKKYIFYGGNATESIVNYIFKGENDV